MGTLDQQLHFHPGLQLIGGEDCGGGAPEEAAEDFLGAQTVDLQNDHQSMTRVLT